MITEDNFTILIPARKGSKGLPLKNRTLFDHTAKIIPKEYSNDVYVSTDDAFFYDKCNEYGFNYHSRKHEHSMDTSTSKDFVQEFLKKSKKYLITLYLTYPERKWESVERAIKFFNKKKSKSLLCKKEINTSPYLMLYELKNDKGKQIIKHNLCRRQDYKKCFELSHFISIIEAEYVYKLNNNLYNEDTDFMPIKNYLDIDTKSDLESFNEKN